MRCFRRTGKILLFWLAVGYASGAFLCFAADSTEPEVAAGSVGNYVYAEEGLRDPLVPLLSAKQSEANEPSTSELFAGYLKKININGVIWDANKPLVMINNEIYRLDDVVKNLRISEITPESVTVRFRDLSHTILLLDINKYE